MRHFVHGDGFTTSGRLVELTWFHSDHMKHWTMTAKAPLGHQTFQSVYSNTLKLYQKEFCWARYDW